MTFDANQTTRVQRAVRMAEVPPEKWTYVVRRTITGTVLIGFGIAGATLWQFPWYASSAFMVFGATVWSSQLVTQSLKALLGPVRAYKRALKDGDDA